LVRLHGKVAIITGAGSGIGQATAILFAKEGAKVIVASRGIEAGEETVRMINKTGGEATFIKTDVSKTNDVKNMVKAAVAAYGKLNVLCNNAAIAQYEPLIESTEDNFDNTIATNLKGVWLAMKYAIPEMIKAGGGSIINISSLAADAAQHGAAIYGASKAGVISMSKVAALEHAAHNIRVNVIKPGPTATPLLLAAVRNMPEAISRFETETPQGRLGEPEEVAQAILFLASDEASHITGQELAVDGGIEADGHIL